MIWWYWMVLGLGLLGAEMTTPGGFYILFFGLSALLVGTLAGLEICPDGLAAVALVFRDCDCLTARLPRPVCWRRSGRPRGDSRMWIRWSAKPRSRWRPWQPAPPARAELRGTHLDREKCRDQSSSQRPARKGQVEGRRSGFTECRTLDDQR